MKRLFNSGFDDASLTKYGEIAILVNSETASAAEIFVQIMQRLPNVTVYATGESVFSPDVLVPADAAAICAVFDEGEDYLLAYVQGKL